MFCSLVARGAGSGSRSIGVLPVRTHGPTHCHRAPHRPDPQALCLPSTRPNQLSPALSSAQCQPRPFHTVPLPPPLRSPAATATLRTSLRLNSGGRPGSSAPRPNRPMPAANETAVGFRRGQWRRCPPRQRMRLGAGTGRERGSVTGSAPAHRTRHLVSRDVPSGRHHQLEVAGRLPVGCRGVGTCFDWAEERRIPSGSCPSPRCEGGACGLPAARRVVGRALLPCALLLTLNC